MMSTFPEFVYSTQMQVWLFFISCITTAMSYLGITELITMVYGQNVSRRRKVTFGLILSLGLNQFWIYGIYALGSFQSFSPLAYGLIVCPNPLFAFVYYGLGVKVLKFSKYRSVRVMRIVYLYLVILHCLRESVGVLFMVGVNAGNPRYNFLADALSSITYTGICLLVYSVLRVLFRKNKFQIQLYDSLPIRNLEYELLVSFGYAALIYAIATVIPWYFEVYLDMKLEGYVIVGVFLVYMLISNTMAQYTRTVRRAIDNKDVNMRVLRSAVEDFSGLKHDFFNILQTYEGYIAIGDVNKLKKYHETLISTTSLVTEKLDLVHQMPQNPEFASMLMEKQQVANTCGNRLTLKILCDIEDFYMPREDLCFAISQLLDIALRKGSREKNTIFSIEEKNDNTKLIIINGNNEKKNMEEMAVSNFDPAIGTRDTHAVLKARKILYKYNNVFFHGTFSSDNFFAYIELRPQM